MLALFQIHSRIEGQPNLTLKKKKKSFERERERERETFMLALFQILV